MDDEIRHYADALYMRASSEVRRKRAAQISSFKTEMLRRGFSPDLPIGGTEYGGMIRIDAEFIGDEMMARLSSFQMAFAEAGTRPSSDDLNESWRVVEEVQEKELQSIIRHLKSYGQHRGATGDPTGSITSAVAHQHDRVLEEWKVWRAQARLVPAKSLVSGFTDEELQFARMAIEQARKSVAEDARIHPKVGVIVVKDGMVLAAAYRGESSGCHAEFIALEEKLRDIPVAGSTVYTTLEPCTERNHPKIPCAHRLGERKVARVVIGMYDPNPRILTHGVQVLRDAGIRTDVFPDELMREVEELNRDFRRLHKSPWNADEQTSVSESGRPCDEGKDPIVVLEYEWGEARRLGERTIANRKFILRNRGGADAVDVQVESIVLSPSTTRFPIVPKVLKGDHVAIDAEVEGKSPLLAHDFESVLMDEWNSKGKLEELDPIPVRVSYRNYSGGEYATEHFIEYNVFNGTARTRFVRCVRDTAC